MTLTVPHPRKLRLRVSTRVRVVRGKHAGYTGRVDKVVDEGAFYCIALDADGPYVIGLTDTEVTPILTHREYS